MSAFDGLRQPPVSIAPARNFAEHLRARITAALATTIQLPDRSPTMAGTRQPATTPRDDAPASSVRITPYLAVRDAAEAIDWYVDVFGARDVMRYVGDDGRIGHAELDFGGASIYLSDEYPDHGAVAPATLGGTAVSLTVNVPDVDAVWVRAVAGGAVGHRPPEDQPYGDRSSVFVDPFGHRWMVQTTIANPTTDEIDDTFDGFTIVRGDDSDPTAH